jgi:two-component system chemotaxis sensor kinase CheA
MIIEDEELRLTFKVASEEHLQKLDEGLLSLEKHPEDRGKLEELMREAHSLKGDAGMLGVKDIATLAHQWEHLLGSVKRDETTLTPEICDRLYHGLDAIRKLVNEAVTGENAQVNTFYVLAELMGAKDHPAEESAGERKAPVEETSPQTQVEASPEPNPAIAETGETPEDAADRGDREVTANEERPETRDQGRPTPTPVAAERDGDERPENDAQAPPNEPEATRQESRYAKAPEAEPAQTPTPKHTGGHLTRASEKHPAKTETATSEYRIDTIRVETRHLDALMTQAGELTVTKIRIAHRLAEVEDIVSLWEEWSRDAFLNRFALEEVGRGNRNGAFDRLNGFFHRVEERLERLGDLVTGVRNAVYEDNTRLDLIADELEEGIRTLRLLPLSNIFNLFGRMVRDLAKQQGKRVELVVEGGETRADKRILEEMKDPLMHMIRNAIDHGIETPREREARGKPAVATIHLKGYQNATNILIEVSDDGRGLDVDKIKQTALQRGIVREEELATMSVQQVQNLIFAPGFSTRTFVTEVSGRGVGLDVVRANVERLKGTIQVESTPGAGCSVRIQLGTTLATAHVLLVSVEGIAYALPVEFIYMARLVPQREIFAIEGRDTILFDDRPISVVPLVELLELPARANAERWRPQEETLPCIVLQVGSERLGVLVDALVDEQDVVLKAQSKLLKRVRNVSGATILGTGEVCMVLNPQDLIESVRQKHPAIADSTPVAETTNQRSSILLVEDSIATRTQEKRILEAAGYEVVAAVDGMDALNKLDSRRFDAIVSDIQMPNLDGLGMTAKIRENQKYSEVPIILVTSLASDDDKRRGLQAGANAYITKTSFNQEVLLETLQRLI